VDKPAVRPLAAVFVGNQETPMKVQDAAAASVPTLIARILGPPGRFKNTVLRDL